MKLRYELPPHKCNVAFQKCIEKVMDYQQFITCNELVTKSALNDWHVLLHE